MSEGQGILVAIAGAVLFCLLLWPLAHYEFRVRQPRRDIPKLNSALDHVERYGVTVRPGEKLRPHSERFALIKTALKEPDLYKADARRLDAAIQHYTPYLTEIKRDISKRAGTGISFPTL